MRRFASFRRAKRENKGFPWQEHLRDIVRDLMKRKCEERLVWIYDRTWSCGDLLWKEEKRMLKKRKCKDKIFLDFVKGVDYELLRSRKNSKSPILVFSCEPPDFEKVGEELSVFTIDENLRLREDPMSLEREKIRIRNNLNMILATDERERIEDIKEFLESIGRK